MSEQTEWIDADERKPEDGQRIAVIVRGHYMDSVHGVSTYANGSVSPEGREPCKWSAVKWWLPLPPEPDPPDERKQALEDVFGGEWKETAIGMYACDTVVVHFNSPDMVAAAVRFGEVHWNLADDLHESLKGLRRELAETRDQLDDLLGPYEYDPDTVAHPSEHLREWCEARGECWRDTVDVKHWKDVEFVLAGGSVDHRDVAHGIAEATGIDMGFWLNLQRKYDEVHGG